jgi:predicted phage-related endonuclease
MSDSNEFSPETRATGWWSTDCRRAVNGEAVEVILEKQRRKERAPITNLPERQQEAIQMGTFMQPTIARLFEDKHKIRVKQFDVALSHPTEPWCKSHFDYITEDNTALVEIKNYNLAAAARFSEEGEPVRMPNADMAQCIHEACVARVSVVYLAVLFGGQHFRTFRVDVDDEMKAEHLKHYATLWAHVVQNTLPDPKSAADARLVWPQDNGDYVLASAQCETLVQQVKQIKAQRKMLENQEDEIGTYLQLSMGNSSEIRTIDGKTLVTWKAAKATQAFDVSTFKAQLPETYERFIMERTGSRRLLIK